MCFLYYTIVPLFIQLIERQSSGLPIPPNYKKYCDISAIASYFYNVCIIVNISDKLHLSVRSPKSFPSKKIRLLCWGV